MSAFVVDPETINRIINSLEWAVIQESQYPSAFPNLKYLATDTLREDVMADPAELGRTLYQMNINAVQQRYGYDDKLPGCYDENDNLLPYVYQHDGFNKPDPIQVYKSIQCYLYQCSEGDVPKLSLYKAVEDYMNALACHIVDALPAYEHATWD